MAWAFATEVTERRRVTITCEGALVLSGTRLPELTADVPPADVTEAEDQVTFHFDDSAHVSVFDRAAGIEVEHVEGELRARRLKCGLRVADAIGDVEIADHEGGVEVGKAAGEVKLSGVNGGASINAAGRIGITRVNGGIRIGSCGGDIQSALQSGSLKVDSCAGDASIENMSGGVSIDSLAGDLKISRLSGGMQIGSVAGDLQVENTSGGLDVSRAAGDANIRALSGSVKLSEVGGDCAIESQSGSIEVGVVRGDLAIRDAAGRVRAQEVGGSLSVRKAGGEIRLDRVGGTAVLERVEGGNISVIAVGDIRLEGKLSENGRCELVSEEGSISIELPEEPKPVLIETSAGGEFACDLATTEADDVGPRLTLRAARDIRVSSHGTGRRPGRPRKEDSDQRPRRSPEELREERFMVLRMVESGKINAEEGARLLDAIGSD